MGARQVGYVEKGTGQHQSNQVFDENGLSRTMQSTDWKDPMLIKTEGGGCLKRSDQVGEEV